MYRSKLPRSGRIIVSKEVIKKIKEFLKNSKSKTQEETKCLDEFTKITTKEEGDK